MKLTRDFWQSSRRALVPLLITTTGFATAGCESTKVVSKPKTVVTPKLHDPVELNFDFKTMHEFLGEEFFLMANRRKDLDQRTKDKLNAMVTEIEMKLERIENSNKVDLAIFLKFLRSESISELHEKLDSLEIPVNNPLNREILRLYSVASGSSTTPIDQIFWKGEINNSEFGKQLVTFTELAKKDAESEKNENLIFPNKAIEIIEPNLGEPQPIPKKEAPPPVQFWGDHYNLA